MVAQGKPGFLDAIFISQFLDDLPRIDQLGLMGMQERVWLLSGSIEVNSEPGSGSTLRVDVPG